MSGDEAGRLQVDERGTVVVPPRPASIGRIVIFTPSASFARIKGGGDAHAAIVTKVHEDGTVNLQVFFDPAGPDHLTEIPLHPGLGDVKTWTFGTWSWPERV